MTLKTGGSTNRLARNATDNSKITLPSACASGPMAGFFKFGWMARNKIIAMSCNTSTPSVTRPASVSSSRLS